MLTCWRKILKFVQLANGMEMDLGDKYSWMGEASRSQVRKRSRGLYYDLIRIDIWSQGRSPGLDTSILESRCCILWMYCISYVLLQNMRSHQAHLFKFPALDITIKYCKRLQPITNQDDLRAEIQGWGHPGSSYPLSHVLCIQDEAQPDSTKFVPRWYMYYSICKSEW